MAQHDLSGCIDMTTDDLNVAEQALGYAFRDRGLLQQALTHASLADGRLQSNERLEFLGDAILGMVICVHLFTEHEELLEGDLTKIKSSVVSRLSCAQLASQIGLDRMLKMGKGMCNRGTLPVSVLSAVYESVIGAIFLDGGFDAARQFILNGLAPKVRDAARSGHQQNYKSVLQQAAQQLLNQPPLYIVLDEKGPDHSKCFEICVEIGARRFPSSWGASKKQAEQGAALQALLALGAASRNGDDEVQIADLDDIDVSRNGITGDHHRV
jgi:ribonuclease III